METTALDDNNPQPTPIPTLTLDTSQYFLYQTHQLEVQAPDGRHLDFIGQATQNDASENRIFRLRDQVALVSCLLGNINDSLNLPIPAVLGLTDLLEGLNDVCYQQLKHR